MKATVVHGVIEAIAGSERVAISIASLLRDLGFDVELLLFSKPDPRAVGEEGLETLRGVSVRSIAPVRVPGLGIYQRVLAYVFSPRVRSDLVVVAHGDLLPHRSSSGLPTVHYCHYPLAVVPRERDLLGKYASGGWRAYYELYRAISGRLAKMVGDRDVIVANSRFVQRLIKAYLGLDPEVIYPPVDVERFLDIPLDRGREELVLMIGRYSPEKGYEDALRILVELPSSIRMAIIGRLTRSNIWYYKRLAELARKLGVEGRVELIYNAPASLVKRYMERSSAYLHMYRGEHFGISVVEAMAAGLIPVTWSFGGPSEYVPKEYLFQSFEEAPEKILKALKASKAERARVREISLGFSEKVFRRRFRELVERILAEGAKP